MQSPDSNSKKILSIIGQIHPSPGVAAKKMTKAEWPSKQGVVSVVQLDDLSLCSFAAAMSYCTSEGRVGPRSQVHQMWQPTALMDQLALTKDKTFIRIIFIYFEPEFDGDFKKGRYA